MKHLWQIKVKNQSTLQLSVKSEEYRPVQTKEKHANK